MVPVRSRLRRASIRVGREFVRLGRRSVLRHMARKRGRIKHGVGRIRSGRDRGLILVRRGTHDSLVPNTLGSGSLRLARRGAQHEDALYVRKSNVHGLWPSRHATCGGAEEPEPNDALGLEAEAHHV